MRYQLFIHQMELERIHARGEAGAQIAEAIAGFEKMPKRFDLLHQAVRFEILHAFELEGDGHPGLAGACGGLTDDIAPIEQQRQRLGLDGGHLEEAERGEVLKQRLRQGEQFKGGQGGRSHRLWQTRRGRPQARG